ITRKSCAGVCTFLALTNALHVRAICMVSEGRSCKSSSKSVSGSVRGNCMDTSPVGSRGIFDLMQYALIFYDFQLILAQMGGEGLDANLLDRLLDAGSFFLPVRHIGQAVFQRVQARIGQEDRADALVELVMVVDFQQLEHAKG